jgi:hypothetical protein
LTAPPPGRATGAEGRGRTAGKLFEEWKSAGKAATRPDDDKPQPTRRRSSGSKEKSGGGFLIPRRARLKTAWRGSSARIAKRQAGRSVIGLMNVAARAMTEIARELKRHLIRAHPLDIARQQREAEQRHAEQQAKVDQEKLAAIDEEFQKWLEEQRRLMMEAESHHHHGAWRPWNVAADDVAILAAVQMEKLMPEEDDTEGYTALDAANPFWDCSLDMDGDSDFNAGFDDARAAPSLDL